jgi:hypothetical protein
MSSSLINFSVKLKGDIYSFSFSSAHFLIQKKGFRNSETHAQHQGASVLKGSNDAFLCLSCVFETLKETKSLLISKKMAIREVIKVCYPPLL